MGFIPLRCPSCGAEIQLDDSREFGFCQYCGTKIVQDKVIVEHRGSVSLDRSDEIENLLMRANEMVAARRLDEAESYLNRVLDIDFNNAVARQVLGRINTSIDKPNLFISRLPSQYGRGIKMKIIINGQCCAKLDEGESVNWSLAAGRYSIEPHFTGYKKVKPVDIYIQDRHTKYNFNFIGRIFCNIESI